MQYAVSQGPCPRPYQAGLGQNYVRPVPATGPHYHAAAGCQALYYYPALLLALPAVLAPARPQPASHRQLLLLAGTQATAAAPSSRLAAGGCQRPLLITATHLRPNLADSKLPTRSAP
jgi:hypothetical protein